MLSFELSVIDIGLAIAVVVLFILFFTLRQGSSATKSELPVEGQKSTLEKLKVPVKNAKETSTTQPLTDFQKCVHHFGYLRNLPKNSAVPDECFGCPKVLRCLFPNE